MKTLAAAYVAASLCMLVLDVIWLSTMARVLYRPHLGDILLENFRLAPAIVFYFVYVAGIVFLAINPALRTGGNWQQAALYGAALGLVAYATYDLTNQATLKTWSTIVTVADICWGTFITAASATAGFLAARAVQG